MPILTGRNVEKHPASEFVSPRRVREGEAAKDSMPSRIHYNLSKNCPRSFTPTQVTVPRFRAQDTPTLRTSAIGGRAFDGQGWHR